MLWLNRKEITEGTVKKKNHYKSARLFCVMNDVIINWQKIAKKLSPEKDW